MKNLAVLITLCAAGCVDDPSAPPTTCSPVIAVDGVHADASQTLAASHDGNSYCLRVDTTDLNQPHLVVTTPFETDFSLELRELDNTMFATGEVIPGDDYAAVHWDPAGGAVYDVLIHVQPRPPIISGGPLVSAQLSVRQF